MQTRNTFGGRLLRPLRLRLQKCHLILAIECVAFAWQPAGTTHHGHAAKLAEVLTSDHPVFLRQPDLGAGCSNRSERNQAQIDQVARPCRNHPMIGPVLHPLRATPNFSATSVKVPLPLL